VKKPKPRPYCPACGRGLPELSDRLRPEREVRCACGRDVLTTLARGRYSAWLVTYPEEVLR